MKINRFRNDKKGQQGMTLLECLVALVVTLVGILAVFVLVTYSVQMHVDSRDTAKANSLAKAKVEELKNSAPVVGGDLNSDVTGYFDSPSAEYTRRWQVANGPQATQTISVRMVGNNPDITLPEITIVTRMR